MAKIKVEATVRVPVTVYTNVEDESAYGVVSDDIHEQAACEVMKMSWRELQYHGTLQTGELEIKVNKTTKVR